MLTFFKILFFIAFFIAFFPRINFINHSSAQGVDNDAVTRIKASISLYSVYLYSLPSYSCSLNSYSISREEVPLWYLLPENRHFMKVSWKDASSVTTVNLFKSISKRLSILHIFILFSSYLLLLRPYRTLYRKCFFDPYSVIKNIKQVSFFSMKLIGMTRIEIVTKIRSVMIWFLMHFTVWWFLRG